MITEEIALQWLDIENSTIHWKELIDHFADLRNRTYENAPIVRNVLVTTNSTRGPLLSDRSLEKIFAGLGNGSNTYLGVGRNIRVSGYEEILLDKVKEVADYKFHPDFLHPLWSALGRDDYSASLTRRGDIIIMNRTGLLAASRRGRWHIYDPNTLKNCIGDMIGDYRVGCNLFDVVFDLSYKRHGALLIYDPDSKLQAHIVNKGSIIGNDDVEPDSPRKALKPSVHPISIGSTPIGPRKKRLFLELASIDGAVVFNKDSVMAFGAIIQLHKDAAQQHGARTTAALSAYLWGGRPVKVSADGDIEVYFTSYATDGRSCPAVARFM